MARESETTLECARKELQMSEENETFPNALEAALLLVVLFGVEIAIASVLLNISPFDRVQPVDLSGLIAVAGNGLMFCFLLSYKKLRYRDLFHSARNSVAATLGLLAIPVVLLVPGLVIVAGTFNAIVVKFLPMSPEDAAALEMMVVPTPLTILFGCVIAPFLEEMLFRGIILRSFLRQYSRTGAILGSSALFGLAHLNVYQFVTAMAVGIVAGWLYERTRSLWPCILLHAAYNAFVIYSQALYEAAAEDFSAMFYFAVFGLAIGSGLFLLKLLMPAGAPPRR